MSAHNHNSSYTQGVTVRPGKLEETLAVSTTGEWATELIAPWGCSLPDNGSNDTHLLGLARIGFGVRSRSNPHLEG